MLDAQQSKFFDYLITLKTASGEMLPDKELARRCNISIADVMIERRKRWAFRDGETDESIDHALRLERVRSTRG